MTISNFDIFLIESEENPRWLEAAPTFAEAERRARELVTSTHPRCLIYDQSTGKKHIVNTKAIHAVNGGRKGWVK